MTDKTQTTKDEFAQKASPDSVATENSATTIVRDDENELLKQKIEQEARKYSSQSTRPCNIF